MFHSHENQIAAVKKQSNNEQMFYTMDGNWTTIKGCTFESKE